MSCKKGSQQEDRPPAFNEIFRASEAHEHEVAWGFVCGEVGGWGTCNASYQLGKRGDRGQDRFFYLLAVPLR